MATATHWGRQAGIEIQLFRECRTGFKREREQKDLNYKGQNIVEIHVHLRSES